MTNKDVFRLAVGYVDTIRQEHNLYEALLPFHIDPSDYEAPITRAVEEMIKDTFGEEFLDNLLSIALEDGIRHNDKIVRTVYDLFETMEINIEC